MPRWAATSSPTWISVAAPEYPLDNPARPGREIIAEHDLRPSRGLDRRSTRRGARPRIPARRRPRRRQALEYPALGRRKPDDARLQPRSRLGSVWFPTRTGPTRAARLPIWPPSDCAISHNPIQLHRIVVPGSVACSLQHTQPRPAKSPRSKTVNRRRLIPVHISPTSILWAWS